MSDADALDVFLYHAKVAPERPALILDDESVSYSALEGRARSIAAHLVAHRDRIVAIALRQNTLACVSMLAAGLAGACYTPLNVDAPVERLRSVIRRIRPGVILTDDPLMGAQLAAEAPDTVVLDSGRLPEVPPLQGRGKRHTHAYVIFTSGSTGTPKGVIVPRTALNHYVGWVSRSQMITAEDRVGQYSNVAFDLSVLEIFGTLCTGAALCPVVDHSDRMMPARLIGERGITVWISVPSVIDLLMLDKRVGTLLGSLRRAVFCGEPLWPRHVAALHALPTPPEVWNLYGPTEATVSVTALRLIAEATVSQDHGSVALGDPILGMRLYLVGGPNADEGQIAITGPQLAEGYWGDTERTEAVFRTIATETGPERAYLTGDWAERRNGELFFRRRMDFMVKLRGLRIELEDVEGAIRDCGWLDACVLVQDDKLVCVLQSKGSSHFDARALRDQLAGRIEAYAIPRQFALIAEMPRTDTGKLDRAGVAQWFEAQNVGPSPAGMGQPA